MARLVDLSKKPYNLNPSQIEWVESTIKGMTDEEKVGQLFWARVPSNHQIEDLQSYHLSGYILFGRDFEGRSIEDYEGFDKGLPSCCKDSFIDWFR